MAVSNRPWDGSSARFTAEQWRRSCLIHRDGGDPNDKSTHSLPVREPTGEINRRAVHNAAARINQLQGVPADKIAAAARALVKLYGELGEDPPSHLQQLAGSRSLAGDVEYRAASGVVECRSTGDGQRKIGGLASVFERPSQLLPGGFYEVVSHGAFAKSEADGWVGVSCKFEHRDVLGTTRGRTLALGVTPAGLDYECQLIPARSDVYELAQRGDLASSFAFTCLQDSWRHGSDGIPVRTLESVNLRDVSAVSDPAYLDATCAMRSLARAMDAPYSDVERYSAAGELRRFFVRTDRPSAGRRPMSGTVARARARLMRSRLPQPRQRTMSGAQAKAHTLGRWSDGSPVRGRNMSGAQAKARIMGRWSDGSPVRYGITTPTRDPQLLKLRLYRKRIAGGW